LGEFLFAGTLVCKFAAIA